MIVARGENHLCKIYPRGSNLYEWQEAPGTYFYGRPAEKAEKRIYRVQQGVNANDSGVYLLSSNLPTNLNVEDKVEFMGRVWTVVSIGYYYDESRIVNARNFDVDYLIERCPKGVQLT